MFESILLGILQGLTEFLPVSSSGHLAIASWILNIQDQNLVFEVVVHVATALSIVIVYHRRLLGLITGSTFTSRKEQINYLGYLVVGTIPAATIGLLFKDFFEATFTKMPIVGGMLIATGGLLFLTRKNNSGNLSLTYKTALLIGLIQACAIMPGISRSGSTISIALLLGISRSEAGTFSFLLALPAIFGAALLNIPDAMQMSYSLPSMAAGFIASLLSGLFALVILLKFIDRGKMHTFAWYCVILGIVVFAGAQLYG